MTSLQEYGIEYNPDTRILVIDGIKYSRDIFRNLAFRDIGTVFRIEKRDDVVTLSRLDVKKADRGPTGYHGTQGCVGIPNGAGPEEVAAYETIRKAEDRRHLETCNQCRANAGLPLIKYPTTYEFKVME